MSLELEITQDLKKLQQPYRNVTLGGPTNVGKSILVDLVREFGDPAKVATAKGTRACTIGVEFEIPFLWLSESILFSLHIWDTAGQSRFRTITSSYYRQSHAVWCCYSLSDPDSLVEVLTDPVFLGTSSDGMSKAESYSMGRVMETKSQLLYLVGIHLEGEPVRVLPGDVDRLLAQDTPAANGIREKLPHLQKMQIFVTPQHAVGLDELLQSTAEGLSEKTLHDQDFHLGEKQPTIRFVKKSSCSGTPEHSRFVKALSLHGATDTGKNRWSEDERTSFADFCAACSYPKHTIFAQKSFQTSSKIAKCGGGEMYRLPAVQQHKMDSARALRLESPPCSDGFPSIDMATALDLDQAQTSLAQLLLAEKVRCSNSTTVELHYADRESLEFLLPMLLPSGGMPIPGLQYPHSHLLDEGWQVSGLSISRGGMRGLASWMPSATVQHSARATRTSMRVLRRLYLESSIFGATSLTNHSGAQVRRIVESFLSPVQAQQGGQHPGTAVVIRMVGGASVKDGLVEWLEAASQDNWLRDHGITSVLLDGSERAVEPEVAQKVCEAIEGLKLFFVESPATETILPLDSATPVRQVALVAASGNEEPPIHVFVNMKAAKQASNVLAALLDEEDEFQDEAAAVPPCEVPMQLETGASPQAMHHLACFFNKCSPHGSEEDPTQSTTSSRGAEETHFVSTSENVPHLPRHHQAFFQSVGILTPDLLSTTREGKKSEDTLKMEVATATRATLELLELSIYLDMPSLKRSLRTVMMLSLLGHLHPAHGSNEVADRPSLHKLCAKEKTLVATGNSARQNRGVDPDHLPLQCLLGMKQKQEEELWVEKRKQEGQQPKEKKKCVIC